jgi:hypothetical protein
VINIEKDAQPVKQRHPMGFQKIEKTAESRGVKNAKAKGRFRDQADP